MGEAGLVPVIGVAHEHDLRSLAVAGHHEGPGAVEDRGQRCGAFECSGVAGPLGEIESGRCGVEIPARRQERVEHRRGQDPVDPAAEGEIGTVLGLEVDDRCGAVQLGALDHLVPAGRGRQWRRAGFAQRAVREPVELEGVADVVRRQVAAVIPLHALSEVPGHAHCRPRGRASTRLDAAVRHGRHGGREIGAPVVRLGRGGRGRGRGAVPEQALLDRRCDNVGEREVADDPRVEQRRGRLPDPDGHRPSLGHRAVGGAGRRLRRGRRRARREQQRQRSGERQRQTPPGVARRSGSGARFRHERALCPARIVETEWSKG